MFRHRRTRTPRRLRTAQVDAVFYLSAGTGAQTRDDNRAYIRRVGLMTAIAITAHNFPEGLATFFATLESPAVGMALAFAIAIHNIPEGIAIAVPV